MAKRYASVSDMVGDLTDDKGFQERLEDEMSKKALAKALFAIRCAEGITQKEMAERLNCTQSRISKIEHSDADRLKIGDLADYAHALDLQLGISFHKGMNSVECVKFHAFQIKKHLDHLAELAQKDEKIQKGVSEFYLDAFVNILRLFKESANLLPEPEEGKQNKELLPEGLSNFYTKALADLVRLFQQISPFLPQLKRKAESIEICMPEEITDVQEEEDDLVPV